jgi:hypothetical protein
MYARDAILIATLALLALLTFLTIDVMLESGFDILVGASLVILAVIGVGVVGALTDRSGR